MRGDLETRHCRVLIAVHDRRGVGAAARALGLAQSTVSEALLSLERVLGFAVTQRRHGREAALSAAALAFLPHARQLVAVAEAALATVAVQAPTAIRLGTVESVSSFLLPEPLRAFRAAWPQVDVRIASGLCADLRARVRDGELDASLTVEGTDRAREAGLVQQFWPAALRLVVAPDHPLAGRAVSRTELADRVYLFADPEGSFYEILRSWLNGADSRFVSAGSVDGVKRGLSTGEAIGVLPDYAIAEEIERGALVTLRIEQALPGIAVVLSTRTPAVTASPLASLLDTLRPVGDERMSRP